MEIEQREMLDFIQTCSPFDQLTEEAVLKLVQGMEIAYYRANDMILEHGERPDKSYLIRTGSVEVTRPDGSLFNRLDVGYTVGFNHVLQKSYARRDVIALEDVLCYVIEGEKLRQCIEHNAHIEPYFSTQKSKRFQYTNQLNTQQSKSQLLAAKVEEVSNSSALIISPDTSIIDAAKRMTEARSSSLLICNQQNLEGIVTEREFCARVVAQAQDTSQAISTVMTPKPITIEKGTTASSALLVMAKHNISHLPIRMDDGFGMVTSSDLIEFQSHNPVYIVNDINKANDVATLVQLSNKLPQLMSDLVYSSFTAYDIGNLISSVGVAINSRLLTLAEEALGPPPVAYAWVIAGSMARQEQTVHTDQDNGLVLDDSFDETLHDEYFLKLAQFVCDGLNACGYVYCPGHIMPTNKEWRQPVSVWLGYFEQWIKTPDEEALMHASTFFDLGFVDGEHDLYLKLRHYVHKHTPNSSLFLARLSLNALKFTPPLGVFRQFVMEAGGGEEKALNMKKRGVTPVIDVARVFALSAGSNALHTENRLRAGGDFGVLSQSGMEDMVDAYEFIGTVRLQHQCKLIEQGLAPDNFVQPEMISSLERRHLKDAFEVVRSIQAILKQRYM